jgi:hypothetical protein
MLGTRSGVRGTGVSRVYFLCILFISTIQQIVVQ